MIGLSYYTRPFLLFYKDIGSKIKTNSSYLRCSFWDVVPSGQYHGIRAQDLFWSYAKSIEEKAAIIVEQYSIEYWMHLSRRIGVGSGGVNSNPITISSNRFNVLALIQKYGKNKRCGHIQSSNQIDISEVFCGLLMSEEFEFERSMIENEPAQLVFTDFSASNLLEYYKLENLAYEIWVCSAKLRSIAKGVTILVDNSHEEYFYEIPDNALDILISSYDSRLSHTFATETGTVFSLEKLDRHSEIFVPIVNSMNVPFKILNPMFNKFLNVQFKADAYPNFFLFPYPIKKYINAHLPFEKDFIAKYSIRFKYIIIVLAALCYRYFYLTIEDKNPIIIQIMMRGYEGPSRKSSILNEIKYFVPIVCKLLQLDIPTEEEISKAFEFLELVSQDEIDIYNWGSLKLFLKANEEFYIVDYSTIPIILDHLFDAIPLNKHNFRGKLLEESIGLTCFLPTTPCKSINGTKKQIDFSIIIGNVLLIGECKVVARKNSFFLGSQRSLKLRESKVVEKSITEVDEKARWLLANPKGTNYNIENVEYILPIGISPFIEYIHSLDKKFWLNDKMPRVLSVQEVVEFINSFNPSQISYNMFSVN